MSSLLFIYNAKSGFANTIIDISNKLLNPETYSCNLCAITYNTFTENKTWKSFRAQSEIDMKFYHIDEFVRRYPNYSNLEFPIILLKKENDLQEFMSSKKINALKNVEDLISVIENKSKAA
ncbi:MAG: GTPase [Flavobacteriaceae bacterium]|nr:GTPase [Flavobacteriaceae bacterium]